MKKLKLLALSGVALMIMAPAFADDFGFSSFGDDAVLTSDSASDDSFGSFDTGVFGGSDSSDDSSSLQITGTAGLTSRVYLEDNGSDFEAGETYVNPYLQLDLSYSDTNSDLTGSILLSEDALNDYPEDIINELTYRAYVNDFVLQAGKTKIVWGRGDKIHVLDLINANDLTNFIIPDYIDRRIAEPEMDVTWNVPSDDNLSLQLVFTPGMTTDRLDTTGRWTPSAVSTLKNYVLAGATLSYADTDTLEYAQYAARLTGTKGTVDWGTEYYFGHYKTPSASISGATIDLDYDKLQVFGVDAETVKGPYSVRGELAYYLTEDIDGDDSSIHNNSIQWVVGFDRDLPWSNLNLNVQELGSYIINYDKVTLATDMDANNADCASNDKIIVKLSDSFKNETLKPAVSVLYGIEGIDLVIMPEVSYIVKDGFEVTASGNFVFSDETTGEYSAYNGNSELQLNVEYSF